MGRGTIHLEACCLSLLGGIQPGRLRSYLVDAFEDGPSNDGLISGFNCWCGRTQLPTGTTWTGRPMRLPKSGRRAFFRKLVEMHSEDPARLRFGSDAQQLFIEWLADLEAKSRAGELHLALISHLSRYRKLMPALALLFHRADWAAAQREVHRGRDFLAKGGVPSDLLADRFHGSVGTQEPIGQRLVFTEEAQQRMLLSIYGLPNWLASYLAKKITLRAFSLYSSNIKCQPPCIISSTGVA